MGHNIGNGVGGSLGSIPSQFQTHSALIYSYQLGLGIDNLISTY